MNEHQDLENPYQPPETISLRNDDEPYIPKVFSFRGRIGRARYLCYSIWLTFLVAGVGVFGGGLFAALVAGFDEAALMNYALVLGILIYIPIFAVFFVVARRRLNDLDFSGWWGALIFVPILNIGLTLCLGFLPGKQVSNRYGPPAISNSWPVIVFGIGVPMLGVLALVIAIVMPLLLAPAVIPPP
ncbi:MAG: DUF805 domain-containing protein [Pseudomonadales bacterium]|nr:DUF805 domain-containing protein [Pseudomonadales bacterium]